MLEGNSSVYEREKVRARERKTQRESVCVCERERKRGGERERERERERGRERERERRDLRTPSGLSLFQTRRHDLMGLSPVTAATRCRNPTSEHAFSHPWLMKYSFCRYKHITVNITEP